MACPLECSSKYRFRLSNMNIIEKSLEVALRAYAGKKDKAGKTYILHPLRIMGNMACVEEMSAALLHDVIEDSDITAQYLLEEGIPSNIVDAVTLLTKQDGQTYEEFINNIKDNTLARKIKIADIEDNINILRLNKVKTTDLERIKKYHKAWNTLNKAND